MSEDLIGSIMTKITEDPEFMNFPTPVMMIMIPYIEQIPEVLGDMLDKPVTLRLLWEARTRVLSHSYKNGLVEQLSDLFPFVPDFKAKLEDAFRNTIYQNQQQLLRLPTLVAEIGKTEQEVLNDELHQLDHDTMALLQSGALSIRQLLITAPTTIIRNTPTF